MASLSETSAPRADATETVIHASAVAVANRALVILGPAGSGKSALALDLMAYGATLLADDRTRLVRTDGQILASAPPTLPPLIEARGIGLLNATLAPPTPVAAAIDLGQTETGRLPPMRQITFLDRPVPLLHKPERGSFAPALLQYLKAGQSHP
ncbi:HPr kinase/phosphorylase [Aestuariibius sp. 2305UL40-4]|uniref:HPr kinase/phosphorylase n=1 Tax=Aestuariibius violaceus TaxID=3234132 RepID=UPI00345E259C